jgi:hypothetical protein
MERLKFIRLSASQLRLDDLAGLAAETVVKGLAQRGALGIIGEAKLQALQTETDRFIALLHQARGSALTPAIRDEDATRDRLFVEIKRVAKAYAKSSNAANADAGTKLVDFLKTYWHISREPMMSQTMVVKLLMERYADDPAVMNAASTVGLTPVFAELSASNDRFANLYDMRIDETVSAEGPSAYSRKPELVFAYDRFCDAVKMALSALPTPELQLLFGDINEIRRKYVARLPKRLDEKHTFVEPIATQFYTGAPVTPLPTVYYRTDDEPVALQFTRDFYVTYRNNNKPGEARLFVHGKGKYTGRYESTFYIQES